MLINAPTCCRRGEHVPPKQSVDFIVLNHQPLKLAVVMLDLCHFDLSQPITTRWGAHSSHTSRPPPSKHTHENEAPLQRWTLSCHLATKSMLRRLAVAVVVQLVVLGAAMPTLDAHVQCVLDKWGEEVRAAGAKLKEVTTRVAHASLPGLEAADKGYLTDVDAGFGGRWMDDGERDDAAGKRDESALMPEGGSGGVEAGMMIHLKAHRESIARQRDEDRQQRLLMHLQHMKAHGHHQPRLKRRDSTGRVVTDEEASQAGSRFDGPSAGVTFALKHDLTGVAKFICIGLLDVAAIGSLVGIPIYMMRRMRRRTPRRRVDESNN